MSSVVVKEPTKTQSKDIPQAKHQMKIIMRVVYKTPPTKEKKMNLDADKNAEASKNSKATVSASIDKIIENLVPERTSGKEPQVT